MASSSLLGDRGANCPQARSDRRWCNHLLKFQWLRDGFAFTLMDSGLEIAVSEPVTALLYSSFQDWVAVKEFTLSYHSSETHSSETMLFITFW